MEVANEIKRILTSRQVAEHYGFEPNRAGYICCPFHNEKTPSLYFKKNGMWKCYGCGRGSSVIDFVMEVEGIGVEKACRKLDAAFSLNLYAEQTFKERRKSAEDREARLEAKRAKERAKAYSDEQYCILCNYRRWLAKQIQTSAISFDLAYIDRLLDMFLGNEKLIEFDASARVNALLSKHPNRGDYDLHSGEY